MGAVHDEWSRDREAILAALRTAGLQLMRGPTGYSLVPAVTGDATLPGAYPSVSGPVALAAQDLEVFREIAEQFGDCGETTHGVEVLMSLAARGYLQCERWSITAKGEAALASIEPPLFRATAHG